MIFAWAVIGTIVGLLMGLTAAGGAVIAVPLFVYLVGVGVRDATTLSLIAVLSGSLLNWFFQFRDTDYRLSALFFAFSALGSFAFTPVKEVASDWVITGLFLAVTFWSLYALWKNKGSGSDSPSLLTPDVEHKLIKGSAGGFLLGGLITMTGLGGGVMLLPLMRGVFRMPMTRALATSLLTIFASSAFSIWLQLESIVALISPAPVIALVAGTVIAALVSKQISGRMQPETLERLRLGLISAMILISAGSLIVKTANSAPEVKTMSMKSIEMTDLKDIYTRLGPGEKVLDVRTPEEFAAGHVPGAHNIDHESVSKHTAALKKYEKVYVYCRSGKRAAMAVNELASKGLKNLILVKDSGMPDWTALGLPEAKGSK